MQELKKLDISFHMLLGDPTKTVLSFVSSHNIGGIITDFSPLRETRNWLDEVVRTVPDNVPVFEVSFPEFTTKNRNINMYKLLINCGLLRLMPTILCHVGKPRQSWNMQPEQSGQKSQNNCRHF
jgi:hypothetical protein